MHKKQRDGFEDMPCGCNNALLQIAELITKESHIPILGVPLEAFA